MTANDLINSALRLTGMLAAGEIPPPEDSETALMVFQQMVDAWNADRLAIYTTQSRDFPFVLNQQTYTLGPGGDFDMPRPAQIDGMSSILLSPDPSNPIEVPLAMYTVDEWQTQIPVKHVTGNFPLICYDTGDYPLRTLNFWPIPTQQPTNCRIYSWQPLASPATYATQINFPPGYGEAFRYNLAVRLQPEFAADKPLNPTVASLAVESLARIKTMNAPELDLRSDLVPNPSGYNYKADLFGIGL
jgi:hypothetical protein